MRRWLHKTCSERKHAQRVATPPTGYADMTWCYAWSLAVRVKDLVPCANGEADVHPVTFLCRRKKQSPRCMRFLAAVCKGKILFQRGQTSSSTRTPHKTYSRIRADLQNHSRHRLPIFIIFSSIPWLRLANGRPVKKCLTDFPLMHKIGAPVSPLKDIRGRRFSRRLAV